jgi:hypothetical protein
MGIISFHANGIVGFNGLNFLSKLSRMKLQCNSYFQIKFLHIMDCAFDFFVNLLL